MALESAMVLLDLEVREGMPVLSCEVAVGKCHLSMLQVDLAFLEESTVDTRTEAR